MTDVRRQRTENSIQLTENRPLPSLHPKIQNTAIIDKGSDMQSVFRHLSSVIWKFYFVATLI